VNVGMVGLGLLGTALAERFLRSGWAVTGFDIDPERTAALARLGGRPAAELRETVADVDRLVLSLPTSAEVEAALDALGLLRDGRPAAGSQSGLALRAGLVIVDTTTGDPERTAALGAALAARGVRYLDAAVSGSSEQVRAADVVLLVGGDPADVAACADLFGCFARRWLHAGPWGAGARLKLVVNLVLGLNRAALAEGLAFARACGVDPETALEALRAGAAYSRVMDVKGRKMIAGDFTCQARLSQHLKDVRLILAAGRDKGAYLPLSAVHKELLERLEAAGLGRADNAAIIRAFDREA
jgi:3-hydroxyisobutyrate dehydrogenase-like beta-hydroxyacid dehydrogenase